MAPKRWYSNITHRENNGREDEELKRIKKGNYSNKKC